MALDVNSIASSLSDYGLVDIPKLDNKIQKSPYFFKQDLNLLLKNSVSMSWDIQSLWFIPVLQFGYGSNEKLDFYKMINVALQSKDGGMASNFMSYTANLSPKRKSKGKEGNAKIEGEIPSDSLLELSPLDLSVLFVESVNVPSISASPLRTWTGNSWVYGPGRVDLTDLTITFRDVHAGVLYMFFKEYFKWALTAYPEEMDSSIVVCRIDFNAFQRAKGTAIKNDEENSFYVKPIVRTNTARILSITPGQFNQGKEVATFTVNFTYNPINESNFTI